MTDASLETEGQYSSIRRIIDKDTKEWSPDLDTVLPIAGEQDIPNFKAWINWNGFDMFSERVHKGFDFAAYLTIDNRIVLGLPRGTKVRAVADGVVRSSARGATPGTSDYYGEIRIVHGDLDNGLLSVYGHVIPSVSVNEAVKKGGVIGTLYTSAGNDIGYLVHLHLQLHNSRKREAVASHDLGPSLVDPRVIDESIYQYSAEPQGKPEFVTPGLNEVHVEIAHFKQPIL